MALGKLQKHALEFARKYPGWHSYDRRDGVTKLVIKSLVTKRLVEVNEYYQFRHVENPPSP